MFWLLGLIGVPAVAYRLIDHYYPGKIYAYLYKGGWNTLEIISRCEIYAENTYEALKPYLPTVFFNKQETRVKFIQQGEEIGNYELNEFLSKKENTEEDFHTLVKEADFFLYEIPATPRDKNYATYILRYDQPEEIIEIKHQTAVCPVKLDVIRFEFKNSVRVYNIKFEKEQYIIPGNKLFDRAFLEWCLKTQHNLTLKEEDKYIVSFIDQEMNYVSFDEHSYILIKKDSYELMNVRANTDSASI